jgi:ATP-dependent DNA helicase DinG
MSRAAASHSVLADRARQALSPGGPISRALAGFVPRPQQLTAASAIAETLERGGVLLLEAPTGTGKSLAALVPLALWVRPAKCAIYSTATITLQDQLAGKDIPTVQLALGAPRAAVAKGMQRYLCLAKWASRQSQGRLATDPGSAELEEFAKWVHSTRTGDQSELAALPEWWHEVAADHSDCIGPACTAAFACFALRARERVRQAELVCCNHHLLLTSLRHGARLADRDAAIVIDEAHRLADIASAVYGESVTVTSLLSAVRAALSVAGPRDDDPVRRAAAQAASACLALAEATSPPAGQEFSPVRPAAARAAARLAEHFSTLRAAILSRHWSLLPDRTGCSESDRAAVAVRLIERRITALQALASPGPGNASWVEAGRSNGTVSISFHSAPVDPGEALRGPLWEAGQPRILMSATMTALGSFTHLRRRLGIQNATELVLPPAFDYPSQMRYWFPRPPLDPGDPDYVPAAAERLLDLLLATRGRALVLFTSYAHMEETASLLEGRLPYTLIVQGQHPGSVILDAFRNDVHSVLFATSRMWEGVDVPGEALSVLVIMRLPFDVPDHPLVAARCDAARACGLNPFQTVLLPDAISRLRQGVGRLIRAHTDRGVVAILDGRVLTRPYGRLMLASLPRAPEAHSLREVSAFLDSRPSSG